MYIALLCMTDVVKQLEKQCKNTKNLGYRQKKCKKLFTINHFIVISQHNFNYKKETIK